MSTAPAPLDDPSYTPEHPPIDGVVPAVVERFGPRTQVRWFRRFGQQLRPQSAEYWGRFYTSSEQHRGSCCFSCWEDMAAGYVELSHEYCCCRAIPPTPDSPATRPVERST